MRAYGKTNNMNSPIAMLDLPRPEAKDGELMVKVEAIGVGVHDTYFHAPDVSYPYVIGIEGAGTIEEIRGGISEYKTGERIAFISAMQPKGGTWAEYAVVSNDSLIVRIPTEISFEQAAAVPVAGNTMFKILHAADVPADGTLFIAGGAGAIGSLLIQVAKQRGVTVIASASEKNHDFMKQLGADYTVDYHDTDWTEQVRNIAPDGVDAAVGIHPGTPEESQSVVKDGGVVVAVSGDSFQTERGIVLKGVYNNIDVQYDLQKLMGQIASGDIKQRIETHTFSDALQALEKVSTRHALGKLVIILAN